MPQDIPKDFSKAIEIAEKVFARLPEFLKPGDVMETEITGVGIIRNKIA